ncbi:MAG: hypothetical protein HY714_01100 [Candidatus Omnitrophica bacterium]|nr:hypothetical protein [Candidatus Omnitrophota bacterium]
MLASQIKIEYESSLVEESVFFAVRNLRDGGRSDIAEEFYREREHLYETAAGADNGSFETLNRRWFDRLGMSSIFRDRILEFRAFQSPHLRFVIRRAFTRKEERGEIYAEGPFKTALIAVRVSLLTSPDRGDIDFFLRHELTQLADMLDPGFRYSPAPALGGGSEAENEVIRERFSFLWSLYTAVRLRKKGHLMAEEFYGRRERALEMAFPFWTEETRLEISKEMEDGRAWTQSELIDLAAGRRSRNYLAAKEEGWFRCSLCGFPGFRPAVRPVRSEAVHQRIRSEHREWNPEMEVCEQCYGIYQSRPEEIS